MDQETLARLREYRVYLHTQYRDYKDQALNGRILSRILQAGIKAEVYDAVIGRLEISFPELVPKKSGRRR